MGRPPQPAPRADTQPGAAEPCYARPQAPAPGTLLTRRPAAPSRAGPEAPLTLPTPSRFPSPGPARPAPSVGGHHSVTPRSWWGTVAPRHLTPITVSMSSEDRSLSRLPAPGRERRSRAPAFASGRGMFSARTSYTRYSRPIPRATAVAIGLRPRSLAPCRGVSAPPARNAGSASPRLVRRASGGGSR